MPDPPAAAPSKLSRFAKAIDTPIGLLAFAVVPALIMEDRGGPELQHVALALNWIIWLAFCFECAVQWAAAPRWSTLRHTWFDFVLIVISPPFLASGTGLQATRGLRALRLLRLLRASAAGVIGIRYARQLLLRRKFQSVALIALSVVLFAIGIYVLEDGEGTATPTFGDALWWSVVTATTVGYGDIAPRTPEGRLVAVFLMVSGIGVIGVFTAGVASFFLEQRNEAPDPELAQRLEILESKMDKLLEMVSEGQQNFSQRQAPVRKRDGR